MLAALTGYFAKSHSEPREVYRVGLASVPFLLAVGDLLIGWLLLLHAEIALKALDGEIADRDRAFYDGKVAAAKFFAKNVLPRLTAERKIIEGVDLTVMDLREEAPTWEALLAGNLLPGYSPACNRTAAACSSARRTPRCPRGRFRGRCRSSCSRRTVRPGSKAYMLTA